MPQPLLLPLLPSVIPFLRTADAEHEGGIDTALESKEQQQCLVAALAKRSTHGTLPLLRSPLATAYCRRDAEPYSCANEPARRRDGRAATRLRCGPLRRAAARPRSARQRGSAAALPHVSTSARPHGLHVCRARPSDTAQRHGPATPDRCRGVGRDLPRPRACAVTRAYLSI